MTRLGRGPRWIFALAITLLALGVLSFLAIQKEGGGRLTSQQVEAAQVDTSDAIWYEEKFDLKMGPLPSPTIAEESRRIQQNLREWIRRLNQDDRLLVVQSRPYTDPLDDAMKYAVVRTIEEWDNLSEEEREAFRALLINLRKLDPALVNAYSQDFINWLLEQGASPPDIMPDPVQMVLIFSLQVQQLADRDRIQGPKLVVVEWGTHSALIPFVGRTLGSDDLAPFTTKLAQGRVYPLPPGADQASLIGTLFEDYREKHGRPPRKVLSIRAGEGLSPIPGAEPLDVDPLRNSIHRSGKAERFAQAIQQDRITESTVEVGPEELGLGELYSDPSTVNLAHFLLTRERGVKNLGNNFIKVAFMRSLEQLEPEVVALRFDPMRQPVQGRVLQRERNPWADVLPRGRVQLENYLMDIAHMTYMVYVALSRSDYYKDDFALVVIDQISGVYTAIGPDGPYDLAGRDLSRWMRGYLLGSARG